MSTFEQPVDRRATILAAGAAVLGTATFIYGHFGGRGPAFLGPGWLMIIGAALVGYSILSLVRLTMLRRRMDLTPEELERWGPTLEEVTGRILDGLGRGWPPSRVADELHEERGLPQEVTLKYIIALGKYLSEQGAGPERG